MQRYTEKVNFQLKSFNKNPDYEKGLRELYLRSCLIGDNSEKSLIVKTEPKWLTSLSYQEVSEDGEFLGNGVYESNDFKKSNGLKIKRLDKFCDYYQPLYSNRSVSLLFHTFTRMNQANISFSDMLDNVKYHYSEMLDRDVRGYVWTLEVSESLHAHYHLALAIDRLKIKRIPGEMKFEDLWGQRTGVEFVKKNVRHYMAKYFAKHNSRAIGLRSFGCSRKFV